MRIFQKTFIHILHLHNNNNNFNIALTRNKMKTDKIIIGTDKIVLQNVLQAFVYYYTEKIISDYFHVENGELEKKERNLDFSSNYTQLQKSVMLI